jgi:hypothetical protein
MTVTIYAADDTTVLNTFTGIAIAHPPIFFGYQDSSGIGRVVFASGGAWSPLIDNLTFSPVPEPSTLGLLAAGLAALVGAARRRRRADFRG